MHPSLEKLYNIAQQENRIILGLMSGTSMDGLDLALCSVHGHGKNTGVEVIAFNTLPYTEAFRKLMADVAFQPNPSLHSLCRLNIDIAAEHVRLIRQALQLWKYEAAQIDLIASHGQTIYHAPDHTEQTTAAQHSTLQMGDADYIAVNTGIICVSDFRQNHIAAGGEGAPLAVYADYLLFASDDTDTALINLGGIANITFIPKGCPFSGIKAGDTGPGNALLDAWIRYTEPTVAYDQNGQLAAKGKVHEGLLQSLMLDPYLTRPLPKSTGKEHYHLSFILNALHHSGTEALNTADILATLARFTAFTVAEALRHAGADIHTRYIVTGGGVHHVTLMADLAQLLGAPLRKSYGVIPHPDAKEAVLFALLANEALAGQGTVWGSGAPGYPAVALGKISFPS